MHAATLGHVAITTTLTSPELLLVPAFPLVAFTLLILAGRRIGRWSGWLAVSALVASGILTIGMGQAVSRGSRYAISWAWLAAGDPRWVIGLSVDGMSWLMLAIVTSIGSLIAMYSIGYMRDDPRFSRFFAYFSLFCASMLGLVMADHFVLLYACWELVGLCSYLLIGFWFEKPSAAEASRKAFITTRIGDTGLLLGILLLAWTAGELHFSSLGAARQQISPDLASLIGVLIFLGAVGKSAQFPLHVWLPDAMEGPTPVSALIHAATMVAAGVYLIARTFPLFTPESLRVVLLVGLVTHLFAGTVALTMTDIKRVLAYSTISQLGLMMTALGLGAMSLAMFHLTMHAFCKALLFLGAGSVIHGTHEQDLTRLSGLWRTMPVTGMTFLIAALSLSGVPFLSGFWSKDAILLQARHTMPWVFWCLLVGAAVTATYLLRLYLRCFHGATSPHAAHAHESPLVMTIPLGILAVHAAAVGLLGSPFGHHWFFRMLHVPHEGEEGAALAMVALSAGLVLTGLWLAWTVGLQRRNWLPSELRPFGRRLYTFSVNKYYMDELYDRMIIQPFLASTRGLYRVDQQVIDGAINGAGAAGAWLSQWKERFDRRVVDRLVNGIAHTIRGLGAVMRWIQTGVVHQYLFVVVAAVVVISVALRR